MHLPHLPPFAKQPLVFITTCTANRRPLLAANLARDILTELWTRSAALDGWFVGHYLLMPDHLHLFAVPAREAKPLATWMKTWKSVSSRRIAAAGQVVPPVWPGDYFDHFARSASAYRQKWEYVQQNPVRKGLCLQPADWPYQGTLHDLDARLAG
ncbi:MAG: transposase [Opitutae bacterium]|nr:transposase [Opitutae bacterium]